MAKKQVSNKSPIIERHFLNKLTSEELIMKILASKLRENGKSARYSRD